MEFVGSPIGQEATLVPAAGFRFHGLRAAPFRREISIRSATAPFVALGSVMAARPLVRGASAVLGMGGYASVAPVLAARSLRVPTVVHEQNAVPGLANRWLARIATAMALTFESSHGGDSPARPCRADRSPSGRRSGGPLRPGDLAGEARRRRPPQGRRRPRAGGSQGACT